MEMLSGLSGASLPGCGASLLGCWASLLGRGAPGTWGLTVDVPCA